MITRAGTALGCWNKLRSPSRGDHTDGDWMGPRSSARGSWVGLRPPLALGKPAAWVYWAIKPCLPG